MDHRWHLQQVFSSWILEGDGHDSVRVISTPGSTGSDQPDERWLVTALVDALWDDRGLLPFDVATRLNLPAEATFAHAVRLLWLLCDDDLFPVCTCHAAVQHLEGLTPELAALYHRAVDERLSGQSPSAPRRDDDPGSVERAGN